ncbi:hypothetical protein ASD65_18115 [Microbacterium sp. Root61]|uniref:hypothetical protein n=1 Tax=Microbacterium sp. Root61 TaxID=1736570 RepID=UPI0007020940|nr:hypothetical protein [Microbacterium sp. Root61]KRA22389.1 hypothetical protein ASD65_18115 [Microbacterium sp. Root61]
MTPAPRRSIALVRRIIVGVIIGAFGLAAIGGIVVLLGAELGSAAGRVLGTTVIVGAFSVAVLCCAALAGRRLQVFGMVGAAISAIAALLVIWVIWYEGPWGDFVEGLFRVMWTAVAASVAFALASLLLLLADRTRSAVRVGLIVTLGLFGLVLAMIIIVIWWPDAVDREVFPRALGISAILAALGAVVVPVISLLMPERSAARLSAASVERIGMEAARLGVTSDELIERLLPGDSPTDAPSPPPPYIPQP